MKTPKRKPTLKQLHSGKKDSSKVKSFDQGLNQLGMKLRLAK